VSAPRAASATQPITGEELKQLRELLQQGLDLSKIVAANGLGKTYEKCKDILKSPEKAMLEARQVLERIYKSIDGDVTKSENTGNVGTERREAWTRVQASAGQFQIVREDYYTKVKEFNAAKKKAQQCINEAKTKAEADAQAKADSKTKAEAEAQAKAETDGAAQVKADAKAKTEEAEEAAQAAQVKAQADVSDTPKLLKEAIDKQGNVTTEKVVNIIDLFVAELKNKNSVEEVMKPLKDAWTNDKNNQPSDFIEALSSQLRDYIDGDNAEVIEGYLVDILNLK
jgi:chemotaxis protein histidine kinase CheA